VKGWSLKVAADKANVSATYLQKLEAGEIKSPSPHRLLQIADAYEVPYEDLMREAGYLVESSSPKRGGTLAQALNAQNLTEEEVHALAEYLEFIRSRRRAGG
jgi:transcriptional regulator with XRE-family HTH domain